MKRDDLLAKARAELGTCEVPANSNNVKYNTWFYGHNVSGSKYPWCMAFVSWLFRGEQSLCKKTASCVDALSWFEKKGQIVTKPEIGDLAFFKFNTNNRRTNHVGVVARLDFDGILFIEGNTSVTSDDNGGKVMYRKRKTTNVVAFARPAYDESVYETHNTNSLDAIVDEVIAGKWGDGAVRKKQLEAAGYDYEEIRRRVNEKKI